MLTLQEDQFPAFRADGLPDQDTGIVTRRDPGEPWR